MKGSKESMAQAENKIERKMKKSKTNKFRVINCKHKSKNIVVNYYNLHEKKNKKKMKINSKNVSLNSSDENYLDVSITLKQKNNKVDNDYKPGMITELLQMKKFGNVILPWDPSFGLDPSYEPPQWGGSGPKPVVNPLFDLSKRTDVTDKTISAVDRSIFVGNLDSETKVGDVKKLFRKCGKVIKVKLRKGSRKSLSVESGNQTNAVIRFETVEGCTAALKMNGKLFKERHLRVTFQQACSETDTKRSIFVGNIAFEAGDDDLWKVFEKCGDIESVRVVRDKQTGKSRGFGYVNFKSSASVEKAVTLNKTFILGHELRVMRSEDNVSSRSDTITVKRKNKKRKKLISSGKQETDKRNELAKNNDVETMNGESEHLITKKTKKKKSKKYDLVMKE